MRLATIRRPDGTTVAARLEGDEVVVLPFSDVVALLAEPGWREAAAAPGGERVALAGADLAPPVRPAKVICVGLNYRSHIEEMGRGLPDHPTLFIKFPDTLTGPYDDLVLPAASSEVDWEVELGVVIGRKVKYVSEAEALDYVAGYCSVNDVSERDFQLNRSGTWDKGKGCDTFGPIGPWLVTPDEVGDPANLSMWLDVNGTRRQNGSTRTMIFKPAFLVSYLSQFMSLHPGDVITTGTPPGVGMGIKPEPIFLNVGDVMELGIEKLGSQRQVVAAA